MAADTMGGTSRQTSGTEMIQLLIPKLPRHWHDHLLRAASVSSTLHIPPLADTNLKTPQLLVYTHKHLFSLLEVTNF